MRIAVTAVGTTLDSMFDPRFGRCQHFLIIETEGLAVECVVNPNRSASGAAGTRGAQLLVDRQVTTLLTGEVGPNARRALEAAGITVVTGCAGSIAEAVAGLASQQPEQSV